MTTLRCCVIAVAAASCSAFVGPAPSKTSVAVKGLLEPYGSGVDAFKEIEKTLDVVDQTKLLTKLAKSGLLSKLDKAGVQLKDVEPLLLFAEENGLVAFLGDINDEVLPLLPVLLPLAPLALPLASVALSLPSVACFALAAASFGGAFVVTSFPDDSVTSVALQTFLAVPLATLFPVIFGGLGVATGALSPKRA
mmetsp:Transcript_23271/g.72844  ORF Transcript_23271/g.72844 Transcript_23271/m.72844 type:complete len:194 (-) Transcript_23271:49-630(-)